MSTPEKPVNYFAKARLEMLPFVPKSAALVLDVGCSQGRFGAALKRALPQAAVWGVEPDPSAQAEAAEVLDLVLPGYFGPALGLEEGRFDAIVFNDSLEHFPDHVPPLQLARRLLKPGGALVMSIPNVRYWPHLVSYVVDGDWEYQDEGILDHTHLRFFTKKSIQRILQQAGFEVARIEGINPYRRGWGLKAMKVLLPRRAHDALYLQFALTALRSDDA